MPNRKARELASGYTAEIDTVTEQDWYKQLQEFEDANIYQTWAYGDVTWGHNNTDHLILKKDGGPVAMAQARVVSIPFISIGIAYVRWGPLWRRKPQESDPVVFQQALRALRNEFTCRRGLVLRVFPVLFNDDDPSYSEILKEEGFSALGGVVSGRTILMDLNPSMEELRGGMSAHWKRELKAAENKQLQMVVGVQDDLFEAFIEIYKEMVSRKKFVEPNDIYKFRRIQSSLPDQLKMKIMLCKSGDEIGSGLICSAIGSTAVYLFGATSNSGMKSRGSYFLQWKLLEMLKKEQIPVYNLHGINPERNPGTYKFKNELAGSNGRDLRFLGQFETSPGALASLCIKGAEGLRRIYRSIKEIRTKWKAKTSSNVTK